ncbi:hypothetical protein DM806_21275 [Sphingobium lactosutens]|uniref:hypothetical protein n=1 Tax=Sphingobium lactosutens TaxID=522773 RepID=UPI0015C026E3|nr:hypothetical protein [Sphingobium lactosutens]NWK98147.1 hypothetical protein [Sphingobium lactosutens]
MSRELDFREASVRADAARAQLLATAEDAKARVAPARLKQDVKDGIGGAAKDGIALVAAKVQQRPVAIGAAAGAFGLFLARRPLAALFRRLYVRFRNQDSENSETDDG